MDFQEVAAAVVEAVSANGGDMLYENLAETLPPVVQLQLPRHFERMRIEGTVVLSVRHTDDDTTNLWISVPTGGGE